MTFTGSRSLVVALAVIAFAAGAVGIGAVRSHDSASLCSINCPPPPGGATTGGSTRLLAEDPDAGGQLNGDPDDGGEGL